MGARSLTHWGRVTHICVSKITIIVSDNGLSPGRRQAIIWTNGGILSIESLGTNFSEILIAFHTFPFQQIQLKMSSGKWRPSCLGLNVLNEFHRSCTNEFYEWDKYFHPTHYNGCSCLSMLGFKLIHVSKRGYREQLQLGSGQLETLKLERIYHVYIHQKHPK